jgi:hypothetical protein
MEIRMSQGEESVWMIVNFVFDIFVNDDPHLGLDGVGNPSSSKKIIYDVIVL